MLISMFIYIMGRIIPFLIFFETFPQSPELSVSVCHLTGLAPLHWAVKNNNKSLVKLLIRKVVIHETLLHQF